MKKFLCGILALTLGSIMTFAQDVIGKWKLDDGSAIVEVYKEGKAYNGRIVWLAEPTMPDGTPVCDLLNPDKNLRTRQIHGLNMLSGLVYDGKEYTGGTIYDPGNGKTYNCSMKVEGDILKVRGSLDKKGLFGRTMDWFRVKE